MYKVYLAHKFGGDEYQLFRANVIEHLIIRNNPNIHVFNATAYFSRYAGVLAEEDIMKRCYDELERSDALWLADNWDDSPGCRMEYNYADLKCNLCILSLPKNDTDLVEFIGKFSTEGVSNNEL